MTFKGGWVLLLVAQYCCLIIPPLQKLVLIQHGESDIPEEVGQTCPGPFASVCRCAWRRHDASRCAPHKA